MGLPAVSGEGERGGTSQMPVFLGVDCLSPETTASGELISQEDWNRALLARALSTGNVVAFIGSGCSSPLGYPTWDGFVKHLVTESLDAVPQSPISSSGKQLRMHLEDARLRFQNKARFEGEELTSILQAAQDIYAHEIRKIDAYHDVLRRTFSPRQYAAAELDSCNPYVALLELPIRRFITSNYDVELERAVVRKNRRVRAEYFLDSDNSTSADIRRRRSFTQEPIYEEQLAGFSVSRLDEKDDELIFHCHGWYYSGKSMVVTETDYQKLYLSTDAEHRALQQALSLLYGSSPVLFVGFGLRDEDLLRPLRILHAAGPHLPSAPPLFALVHGEYDPAAPNELTQQWKNRAKLWKDRYGLHVIPYADSRLVTSQAAPKADQSTPTLGDDAIERGRSLHRAILSIAGDWRDWRSRWSLKPRVRTVEIPLRQEKPKPFRHYEVVATADDPPGPPADQVLKWTETACSGMDDTHPVRVLVLKGEGGTGKSRLANQIFESVYSRDCSSSGETAFDGYFSWSSYYANDSLSLLDRALKYADSTPDPDSWEPDDRVSRLGKALRDRRYLFVLDGLERLLVEGDVPGTGRAFTGGAAAFLKELARLDDDHVGTAPGEKQGRDTFVVVTTRVLPLEIDEYIRRWTRRNRALPCPIKVVTVVGPRAQDVAKWDSFRGIDPQLVSKLCGLLESHTLGLVLAHQMLLDAERVSIGIEWRKRKLEDICENLAVTPPDRRVSRMISEALRDLDASLSNVRPNGFVVRVLERVAQFTRPLPDVAFRECYESALGDHVKGVRAESEPDQANFSRETDELIATLPRPDVVLAALVRSRLIEKVRTFSSGDIVRDGYTVHPVVRSFVFHRLHGAASQELPHFTLGGYTARGAMVDPGTAVDLVKDVFNRLCDSALHLPVTTEPERAADVALQQRELCRSALTLIRTRMEATTVPRWSSYSDYRRLISRLGNLARYVARDSLWSRVERRDINAASAADGPFYGDELAWLYNELGLACYAEGIMLDAAPLWHEGYEVNRLIDSYSEGGTYSFQTFCNLGAVNIQLGRLGVAEDYLNSALRIALNPRIQDRDHAGRILGYLALVQHLRGNLPRADELYKSCIEGEFKSRANLRAASVFQRHWADLKMIQGDLDSSRTYVDASRAVAEAGRYPDLVGFARMAKGHWYRIQKRYPEATGEYVAALSVAQDRDIRQLESEVRVEQARLALDQGDAEVARNEVLESLRIANRCGLGLTQTNGLVVLGRAMVKSQQTGLGLAYLRHAKRLAESQEYWVRAHEADALLQSEGRWQAPE